MLIWWESSLERCTMCRSAKGTKCTCKDNRSFFLKLLCFHDHTQYNLSLLFFPLIDSRRDDTPKKIIQFSYTLAIARPCRDTHIRQKKKIPKNSNWARSRTTVKIYLKNKTFFAPNQRRYCEQINQIKLMWIQRSSIDETAQCFSVRAQKNKLTNDVLVSLGHSIMCM